MAELIILHIWTEECFIPKVIYIYEKAIFLVIEQITMEVSCTVIKAG